MRFLAILVFVMLGLGGARADSTAPAPIWECRQWADGTYMLYCGGAYLGRYNAALDCVQGHKQICGSSSSDYRCDRWPDGRYLLYCGGAFLGHYETALACIQGKKAVCD